MARLHVLGFLGEKKKKQFTKFMMDGVLVNFLFCAITTPVPLVTVLVSYFHYAICYNVSPTSIFNNNDISAGSSNKVNQKVIIPCYHIHTKAYVVSTNELAKEE